MNDQSDGVSLQVTISPDLATALGKLADRHQLPLSTFVSVLINEALTHRLLRRPLKPQN
jgi:hypothetical protein